MRHLLLLPLLLIVSCCPKDPLQKGLERFSKVAHERENLDFQGYKKGGEEEIALLFVSHKQVGVDEARRLIVSTFRRLLATLNSASDYPFTEEDFVLGIQFKDPEGNFVESDFIAEVTYYNDELLYYIWEPDNGRRKRVFKEEYSEAFGRAFGHPVEWCTGAGDD